MVRGTRSVCLVLAVLLTGACDIFESTSAPTCEPEQLTPEEGDVLDNGCFDRSDEIRWEFSWAPCDDAQRYHLYVIGPGATFPVVDDRSVRETTHVHRSSGFVAEQNRLGWSWKVRANVRGQYGPWSPSRTFDVEPRDTDCPELR